METPKEVYINFDPLGYIHAWWSENHPPKATKYIRADLAMEKEELDYLIKECVDCLRQCRATLLKQTALDSSEELHRKEIENECALTRRIDCIMGLIDSYKTN